MSTSSETLRSWLRQEICGVLRRPTMPPPLVIWCDPEQAWRDLLRAAAADAAFELWCDGEHELVIRERLRTSSLAPRVVWLPVALEEISYLKVFELQAELVWTESIVSALARFGVEMPRDQEADLRGLLPAHAMEWIDRPLSAWRELTPGTAKSTLVDDDHILVALAKFGVPITDVVGKDRLPVFGRRVKEDFGLPAPAADKDDDWRVAAMSCLLATEAAVRAPAEPPREGDRVIASGPQRDRALKLLDRWQKNIEFIPAFEDLACKADGVLSLAHWARNLAASVPVVASRAAEEALFQKEVEALAQIDGFDPLARRLEEREVLFVSHARGFWGNRAEKKVSWASLVLLSRAATLFRHQAGAEKDWKTPREAVNWFAASGWEIDQQGELLFRDDAHLPASLHSVRARLRRAYLRHLDAVNTVFSDLLHRYGLGLDLPFGGEILHKLRSTKEPTAVLVLDACRYDFGARLAQALDHGEPLRRSEIHSARAPLPSVTALGMAFALADDSSTLCVELSKEAPARWRVTARDFAQDLSVAEARKEWLRSRFKLKTPSITDVKSVLSEPVPGPKETGRMLLVFGDEFDVQGHEGELQFEGAEDYIERYVRAVRQLRDAGYPTIIVVTDHGFVHWQPDQDEVEEPPTGEILWRSRRAVAGRGLKHPTAIAVPVPGSDLECRVPRSINAFRTYGGLGYFHGGATLQELVIPVVAFRWPKKTEKVAAVLTPLAEITSLKPRVEVRPGVSGRLPGLGAEANLTGRQVAVKIVEPKSGRRLFKSKESCKVEPDGEPATLVLEREAGESCSRGSRLLVELRDADNDEILDRCEVELKVDLEEWD